MLNSQKVVFQNTRDKQFALIAGVILGLAGAAAVHHWPKNAQVLQMLLYSIAMIGALIWAAWSRRSHPRFIMAIATMALIHCVVLVGARDMFLFRTILFMVPVALSELIIVFTLMLKFLAFECMSALKMSAGFCVPATTGETEIVKDFTISSTASSKNKSRL